MCTHSLSHLARVTLQELGDWPRGEDNNNDSSYLLDASQALAPRQAPHVRGHAASAFPFWGCYLNHDATTSAQELQRGSSGLAQTHRSQDSRGRAWASLRQPGFVLLQDAGVFSPDGVPRPRKKKKRRKPWYRGCDYLFSLPHFIINSKAIHEHKFVV